MSYYGFLGSPLERMTSRTISENMQFRDNFKVDPIAAGTQTDPMQTINPMIMLMMMQIIAKLTGTELPAIDYASIFPNMSGNAIPGTTQNPAASATQNPAAQYLDERFNALAANADPETGKTPWSEEETAQLKAQVANGTITPVQLGEALMYELDKTEPKNLTAVGQIIASLMESGDLNIVPFLQNDYLVQLQPDNRDILFRAVELSGLLLSNGQTNSRFVAFLIENLSRENPNKESQPGTQALIKQFMQDFYNVHGQTPDGEVGAVLAQIITMTGLTADEEGNLIFF